MTWPCTGAASATSASSFGGSALGFFEPAFFLFLGMSESYAKIAAMVQERRTLDATAFALMLALTVDLRRSVVRDASRDPLDHRDGRAHRARAAFLRARRASCRTAAAWRAPVAS